MKFAITISTTTTTNTYIISDAKGVLGGWVATSAEEAMRAARQELLDALPCNKQLLAIDTGAHLGDLQEDEARWVAEWVRKHRAVFAPYEGELTGAVRRLIDSYLYSQGRSCDPDCTFWGLDEEDSVVISPVARS